MAEAVQIDDTLPPDPGTPEPTGAPTPPAAAPTPPVSLAAGGGDPAPTGDPAPAAPRAIPDDWREQLAEGDEKLLKELGRYSSLKSVIQSWKEARTKLSSGQYKTPQPDNASEEELAQWRQENGIPASASDYKVELGDGMVLGEDDQPLVQSFLEHAFSENLPESAVNAALRWYYRFNDDTQAKQFEADTTYQQEAMTQLRNDWGREYNLNINAIKTLVGDQADYLFSSRGPDGRVLGDNPALLRFLADTARKVYPLPTLIPGGGQTNIETVASELADLRAKMGNPASEYWKGPKAAQLQQRYVDLLEAQDRLSK